MTDKIENAGVVEVSEHETTTALLGNDGTAGKIPDSIKRVTWVQLTFIAYSFTAAGPFGCEEVVKSGGPLIAMISLLLIPTVYVMPQIFIVSEMATMMPSSHGCILWVQRAFGTGTGFYNAVLSVIYNFIDCGSYPNLFALYVMSVWFPDGGYWTKVGLAFVCVCVGTLLSLLSARMVGHASTVMSFAVMIPFIVGVCVGIDRIDFDKVGEPKAIYNTDQKYDFGLLLSAMIWLFTGWRSLGTMGGEVSKPTDFYFGLPLALFLGIMSYLLPLAIALSVPVPAGKDPWSGGYLAVAFNEVLSGLGTAIAVAGALGNICLYSSAMLCYPRMLWGAAERGWAPHVFTKRSKTTHAPYMAVLMHFIVSCGAIFLDFSQIVRLETVVGAGSYILSAVCMAWLRHKEPDTPRPLKFPKSLVGACIVCAGPTLVFTVMLFFNLREWWVIVTGVIVNVAVVILYLVLRKVRGYDAMTKSLDAQPRSADSLQTIDDDVVDGATSPTWIPSHTS